MRVVIELTKNAMEKYSLRFRLIKNQKLKNIMAMNPAKNIWDSSDININNYYFFYFLLNNYTTLSGY
ncbi:MAG: hypothetical protein GWN44_02220 [Calditrichae bacterium]|nr:hypothetical protein [Calditrichia bacterium]